MGVKLRAMRVAWLMAVALVLAAAGCGKSKSAAPAGPVGKVAVVIGDVQATRAGQAARKLEVGADVFGDDVIKTGVGARVELALLGGARYEIGAEAERKLGAQLALLKGGAGAGAAGDVTAAAGRHGEEEAAATEATAEVGGGGSGASGGGPGSGAPEATGAVPVTAPPPGSAPVMAPSAPDPVPEPPAPPARKPRAATRPVDDERASAEAEAEARAKVEQLQAENAAAASESERQKLEELLAAEQRIATLKRSASPADKAPARDIPIELPEAQRCLPGDPLCDPSKPGPAGSGPRPLDAAQVKAVLLPALPAMRRCSEAPFKADPKLTSLSVKLQLEIATSGRVAQVMFIEPSTVKAFDSCVAKKAKALKFSKAGRSLVVRVPVVAAR